MTDVLDRPRSAEPVESGGPVRRNHGTGDRSVRVFNAAVLAIVGVLLVTVETVLLVGAGWDIPPLITWELTVSMFFFSGLLAGWRQPHNPFGLLLIAGGIVVWCAGLQSATIEGLAVIGHITQAMPLAVIVHLVLAFPYGRLPNLFTRYLVIAAYVVSIVLQAPQYLMQPELVTYVFDNPELAALLGSLQRVAGLTGLILAFALVLHRWRGIGRDQRRRLGPLAWYGLVALAGLIATITIRITRPPPDIALVVSWTQTLIVLGLPLLFLAGLLTGAFGRAGALREFLDGVGADRLEPEDLDTAIARALGDPTARIVYSGGADHGFVRADGTPMGPLPTPTHRLREVRYSEEVIGAIGYDGAAVGDPRLVDAVARISALAIDHQRALAALRAALLELEVSATALHESRFRIVQASDVERRRIARDLHDGVQQSIVLLGMRANALARHAGEPDRVRETAESLKQAAADLLEEFRALVHGIMPAALTDRGILSAVTWLGERTALPLDVHAEGMTKRLPQEIESTVYFVVLETVTNVIKHAAATSISVDLIRGADTVSAEVRDDGRGGVELSGSTGLLGLRDRVAALDGSLTVQSPVGSGTVVRVLLPCG